MTNKFNKSIAISLAWLTLFMILLSACGEASTVPTLTAVPNIPVAIPTFSNTPIFSPGKLFTITAAFPTIISPTGTLVQVTKETSTPSSISTNVPVNTKRPASPTPVKLTKLNLPKRVLDNKDITLTVIKALNGETATKEFVVLQVEVLNNKKELIVVTAAQVKVINTLSNTEGKFLLVEEYFPINTLLKAILEPGEKDSGLVTLQVPENSKFEDLEFNITLSDDTNYKFKLVP